MEYKFKALSDHLSKDNVNCDTLEITIQVICTDGEDAYWEDMMIWNLNTDKEVKIESLPSEEVSRIEKYANSLANDKASEVYQSYCEGRADAQYDSWKDEGF